MNVIIKGLSDEEVSRSRSENGSNELASKQRVSFLGKFVKNLGDPIIRILIVAFFVTLIFSGGGIFESCGIALSVFISAFVSTLSEYGSEKAFQRMQNEAKKQNCLVIRNAETVSIPVGELVKGDILCVSAGDMIGADGLIIDGDISVDMSALNGESTEKSKGKSESGTADDEFCRVYRGSIVTAGKAKIRVSSVGKDTYYGKIADEVQDDIGESPLRMKLTELAKTLSKFGYFCAVCVALAYLVNVFFLSGDFVFTPKSTASELLHAFTLGISVVVVAVPEGLPMMITVVLSSNMIRMQKHNIRVRKPVGIETSGNVDILFTDKTGTLTYGTPKVVCYVTGDGVRSSRSVDIDEKRRFLLGACAFFGGDSTVENPFSRTQRRAVGGNAADRAVLSEYMSGGECPRGIKRTAFLPFDSKLKLSCASVDISANTELSRVFGKEFTLLKGAPELLIKNCRYMYSKTGEKVAINTALLEEKLGKLSSKGMRVMALAVTGAASDTVERTASQLAKGEKVEAAELFAGACFVMLICMRDELRREAPKVIKELKGAGIQTVMVTGDSSATARAIALEAGIVEDSEHETVIESEDLKSMSDAEIERMLPSLRVVARALPDDKSRLVRIAKRCGRITAMTGDGLNDAPALKAADVGFAMGNGTDVAKEAGDIILNDGNIASVEKAVLYGRTVFRSIRKFVVFQLIMNLSAVLVSVIGPFIGVETPVTVMQMLWINLIMDTLAAIAFAGEAPMRRYMNSPPVPKGEPVLSGDMITRILCMGAFYVSICIYYLCSPGIRQQFGNRDSAEFLAGFFALFVFCGIFGAFNARSGRVNILSGLFLNPVFVTVICLVFTAQIFMIYSGGELFRCTPLTLSQLRTVLTLAANVIPAGIGIEILLKIGKRKNEGCR